MPSELTVTVVIPAYKRPERLRRAVASVLRQEFDPAEYELIVVDSSPDDENERVVMELQREAKCAVRCIRKKAEGAGPSRNAGARAGRGRILAFLDSDCQASPGWLREGVAAFGEGVGLVQGRTIPEPGVPHGTLSDYIWVEHETFLYETANIMYRRDAFEQSGGFPGDMQATSLKPVGGEDIHVGWTVKRAGWKSRFEPRALVMHDVIPISPWRWLFNKRLFMFPKFARLYPEIRPFFYARYFFDRIQARVVLALAGVALSPISLVFLVFVAPYVIERASEKTQRLRGPLRLLRVAMYLPKDITSFAILLAGSVRYRALLL